MSRLFKTKMDSKIKKIINRIAMIDILNPVEMLGDVIADILFKKRETALLVKDNKIILLLPPNSKSQTIQEAVLRLTELLAVLQNLEKSGLLYVDENYYLHQCFFYQGKDTFEKSQRPGVYKVSNSVTLNHHDDLYFTLNAKDEELMASTVVYDQVGRPLARYLCSFVLPTMSLKNYVNRGFKTREERNTQLGLRYSVISVTIAVIIAVLSPFISVHVANRYGFSTIKQEQMDSLLKTSKPVYVVGTKDFVHQSNSKNFVQKSQKEHGK